MGEVGIAGIGLIKALENWINQVIQLLTLSNFSAGLHENLLVWRKLEQVVRLYMIAHEFRQSFRRKVICRAKDLNGRRIIEHGFPIVAIELTEL